jgi:hypothetical protein
MPVLQRSNTSKIAGLLQLRDDVKGELFIPIECCIEHFGVSRIRMNSM